MFGLTGCFLKMVQLLNILHTVFMEEMVFLLEMVFQQGQTPEAEHAQSSRNQAQARGAGQGEQ